MAAAKAGHKNMLNFLIRLWLNDYIAMALPASLAAYT